jgi:hypothetical protein
MAVQGKAPEVTGNLMGLEFLANGLSNHNIESLGTNLSRC